MPPVGAGAVVVEPVLGFLASLVAARLIRITSAMSVKIVFFIISPFSILFIFKLSLQSYTSIGMPKEGE
ncbi:MAG: hypothetical protein ACD_62C00626G0006 [uncultured bacterium]|nr:MAG: hypothetical protein ACD_62C00626G0006 [uncultured bacterium]